MSIKFREERYTAAPDTRVLIFPSEHPSITLSSILYLHTNFSTSYGFDQLFTFWTSRCCLLKIASDSKQNVFLVFSCVRGISGKRRFRISGVLLPSSNDHSKTCWKESDLAASHRIIPDPIRTTFRRMSVCFVGRQSLRSNCFEGSCESRKESVGSLEIVPTYNHIWLQLSLSFYHETRIISFTRSFSWCFHNCIVRVLIFSAFLRPPNLVAHFLRVFSCYKQWQVFF